MTGFQVFNNLNEIIVDDKERLISVVATQSIGSIELWYDNDTLKAPSFINKEIGVPSLPLISSGMPLTLLKPLNGACGCGNVYYSENAGTLKHLSNNYVVQSGFLDVFNENGDLSWSAKTAESVPRVVDVINVTAQQLINGVMVSIGDNYLMMNNMPSVMYPGPAGALRIGGLYWAFSSGALSLRYNIQANVVVSDYVNDAYGAQGMNIYVYKFAS